MRTPLVRSRGIHVTLSYIALFLGFCLQCIAQNVPTTFTDRTNLMALDNFSGVTIAIADMNGDGKDDIIRLNQGKVLNIEYQTTPRNFFGHSTVATIANNPQWSLAIADADRNGLNDIVVGGAYDNIKLIYNQEGNSNFDITNVENSSILLQGSNFVDINNDGNIDLFACNDDGNNRKFVNDGQGGLRSAANLIDTRTTITSDNSGNYSSIWTDYDNDGDLDLYISKCRIGVDSAQDPRRINQLFQNDGNNNFTEVADRAGLKIGAQTWTTDFADIDNDGDMDAFVANHYDDSQLMINNGNGTFTDITIVSGLQPYVDANSGNFPIQTLFRDFNNDGFVDLLFTGTDHFLFYNNGDRTFSLADNPFGNNAIESVAIGDLDHNGYLDVYASYARLFNEPTNIADDVFFNDGNGYNFIAIQLEGVASNPNAIGARVEIEGNWGTQVREVRAGEGYGIMNTFTQHFGIGQNRIVNRILVKWPSGLEQVVDNPAINTFVSIREVSDCAGQACNDNDPCTTNDVYDVNCNCRGTLIDNDGDGVCDASDVCPGFDDGLIGQACNDGDPCTTGERWDTNCSCSGGIITDNDGDGVCAAQDQNDNDPCIPDGTATPCFGSSDNCDLYDFTGFENSNLGIWNDGGNASRLLFDDQFATTGDFSYYLFSNEGVGSSLFSDPLPIDNNTVVNLSFDFLPYNVESGDSFVLEVAADGNNYSLFKTYTTGSNFRNLVRESESISISNSGFSSSTRIRLRSIANDAVDYFMFDNVAVEFCEGGGTIPTVNPGNCVVGASCDDGDVCTIGEAYDADCNCIGGVFLDSDNDGLCNAIDNCPNFNNGFIGTSCNDGDPCTQGELWDANCNCTGGMTTDTDGDGYCAALDNDDNDPCIPDPSNGACNTTPTPTGTLSCSVLGFTGFENGEMGLWIDGGVSARLLSGAGFARNGLFSFYLQGDDGFESSIYTSRLDLRNYDSALLSFALLTYEAEAGDKLVIELSTDNSNFFTYAEATVGIELFEEYNHDIELEITGINFSSTTTIRIRSISDSAQDYFILDDLKLEGCDSSGQATCVIGTPCNDGDPCTIGSVYDNNCNCVGGLIADSDNDGICDANDTCPNFNNNLIGQPCNDGDVCTEGERWDANCGCSGGVVIDADNDGVCAASDSNDNDPCIPNSQAANCNRMGTGLDCNTINETNFEGTDLGVWNLGGTSATLLASTDYSGSGIYSVYIQGNSGVGSSIFTDPMNLLGYDNLTLEFFLFAFSVEVGDRFHLEIASAGNNYVLARTFESGVDFNPDDKVRANLSLEGFQWTNSTRFRFRAETSGSDDFVIFDDIKLTGCKSTDVPSCNAGTPCDDGNPCTIGETLDQNCNCIGGTYVDADNDGYCVGVDSNDSDPCIPDFSSPACDNGTTGNVDCSLLISESFDNNDTGQWNDGGDLATLLRSTTFANSGSYLFYVQGNGGAASSLTTNALNLIAYNSLELEFNLYPYSMEAGDRFHIEVSTNNGQNYTTYKTFVSGVDFNDEIRQDLLINISGINFTNATRIRFRAQGDTETDYVMLDDINLYGCVSNLQGDTIENRVRTQFNREPRISYYPNPADEFITLEIAGYKNDSDLISEDTAAKLYIYDLQGRIISTQEISGAETTIDLQKLKDSQLYLFRCIIPTAKGNIEHSEMIFKN